MIQIDGLSRPQLEAALDAGRMPFLKRLMDKEHYRLHSVYSGLPSSTPSVQGELFYGIKTVVPAFSFREENSGEILRMYEANAADTIEAKLRSQGGDALLKDGSSYCNIYRGGAAEVNFCPSSPGWDSFFSNAGPFRKLLFIFIHLYSFLRVFVLLLLELLIAIVDFFRGIISRKDFLYELKFIPVRVAICILLRELITIGVKFDITRGLPIIHLNLLGYDEQAHRRGPSSAFAHWSLKGIDDAIYRIWTQTQRSHARDYDIWVYSDHGQEETTPYAKISGSDVETAVNRVFAALENIDQQAPERTFNQSIASFRANLLGGFSWPKIFRSKPPAHQTGVTPKVENNAHVTTAAMGPVGFLYLPYTLKAGKRDEFARKLVTEASIPVVMFREHGETVFYCHSGKFTLDKDAEELFGSHHPFLPQVKRDLAKLCEHRYAGDMLILGWHRDIINLSFPVENGSHAGPGPMETHAFALLPGDAPLKTGKSQTQQVKDYLTFTDIRQAAQVEMGILKKQTNVRPLAVSEKADCLRLMTYNVHSCVGMDGKISTNRIARIIELYQPDIIALQELDVRKARSEFRDQAHTISELLNTTFHFHPVIHVEEEKYGDALLTRLPMRIMKASNLSEIPYRPTAELRGAIWASIRYKDTHIQVINTHLGLTPAEQLFQVKTLFSKEWLFHPQCKGPTILCGDFNALPKSPPYNRICKHLEDAQDKLNGHKPLGTFFSAYPKLRIDHVFINQALSVNQVFVPKTKLTRVSSDHLPLIVDLKLVYTNR